MEVFNLADYAGRGQAMAVNKMKMDEYQRAKQKEQTLQTLAQQHVKEDGSVDLEALANALPAAGFVTEGLELQMQNRKQKQAEAESEFKQAQQTGEAYTKMWTTLKPAAMELLKNGDEVSLNNLNVLIKKVAPQLDYQLPNDVNAAKTEVSLMMPMLEAEGELYKLTTQAAEARALYGEDSEEFKVASKQLIDKQDELAVEKKKLDYELENARLTKKKNEQSLDKGVLEKQKLEQEIKDAEGGKWATKNVAYKGKTVSGRTNDKGEIQIKKDGEWINVEGDGATIAGVKSNDVSREKWDKQVQAARDYVTAQDFTVGQKLTFQDRIKDPNLPKQMEIAMRQKFSEGGSGIPQEAINELNSDPSEEAKKEFEDAFGVSADDFIQ